ncbi:protein of unknown function [Burkholderia multivorans]
MMRARRVRRWFRLGMRSSVRGRCGSQRSVLMHRREDYHAAMRVPIAVCGGMRRPLPLLTFPRQQQSRRLRLPFPVDLRERRKPFWPVGIPATPFLPAAAKFVPVTAETGLVAASAVPVRLNSESQTDIHLAAVGKRFGRMYACRILWLPTRHPVRSSRMWITIRDAKYSVRLHRNVFQQPARCPCSS